MESVNPEPTPRGNEQKSESEEIENDTSASTGWPQETPPAVIAEIEAQLDAEMEDYKNFLRNSISDFQAGCDSTSHDT